MIKFKSVNVQVLYVTLFIHIIYHVKSSKNEKIEWQMLICDWLPSNWQTVRKEDPMIPIFDHAYSCVGISPITIKLNVIQIPHLKSGGCWHIVDQGPHTSE